MTFPNILFVNAVGLRVHLGELTRKQAKESVSNPADLQAGLPDVEGGVAKKTAEIMCNTQGPPCSFD